MSKDLSGKVAIVTGSARGIGKVIAKHLLEQGMSVTLADVQEERLGQTYELLTPIGPTLAVKTDVMVESDIQHMVTATLERFGRIDALINNAGLGNPCYGQLENLPLGTWDKVIRTNLTGPMLCCKYALPALRESKGAIVNISSTRALQTEPHNEAYSASKGGLISLTHALATSHGPVRANCICPGWIVTEEQHTRRDGSHWEPSKAANSQHPVGRVGCSQDIANMVAFLISDKSGFITGQHFVVDGGMTKKMIYS
jgi:NAD(P)-dependent dehydrogenase (short-subunit alcohol dehydrogenase family)